MLTQPQLPVSRLGRAAVFTASGLLAFATCASAFALHTGPAAPAPISEPNASVPPGHLKSQVPPVYPEDAKKAGIQGEVVVHALVGKTGSVEKVEVVSGPEPLRRAALDAVRQWQFEPMVIKGKAVEVSTNISIKFEAF